MSQYVVGYLPNLMLETRVRQAVEAHGALLYNVAQGEGAPSIPSLVLVAFGQPGDQTWEQVIREAREQWPGVPIVAFGPHVALEARRRARALGATYVWARGHFFERLPALLTSYLTSDPEGCAEAPPPLLLEGVALFNRGEFYECHEVLEEAWRQEMRPCRHLYQGLLQVGVALHHVQQGNEAGARKVLHRALRHLERLPARCQGVDVDFVRERARSLQRMLEAEGLLKMRDVWEDVRFQIKVDMAE